MTAALVLTAAAAFTVGVAVAPWINLRSRRVEHQARRTAYRRGYGHGLADRDWNRARDLYHTIEHTINPPLFNHEENV